MLRSEAVRVILLYLVITPLDLFVDLYSSAFFEIKIYISLVNPRRDARSEGYCSRRMCVHSYLPPHTFESQNRDTNDFIAIHGSF